MPDEPSLIGTPTPPSQPQYQASVGASLKVPGIEDLNDNLSKTVKFLSELRQELQNLNNTQVNVFSKLADQLARINKEGGTKSGTMRTGIYGLLGAIATAKTGNADPTLRQGFQSVFTPKNAKKYAAPQGVTPAVVTPIASVPGTSGPAPPPPMDTSLPKTYYGGASTAIGGGINKLGDTSLTSLADFSLKSGSSPIATLAEGIGNLLMKPIQFAFNRVEENREAAMGMAKYLGPTANRYGIRSANRIEELIQVLSSVTPVRGDLAGILQAIEGASQMGIGLEGGRAGGFWGATRQLQMLNPNTAAPDIVQQLGGFMGNASATQRSVLLSGGAFSFQTAGGGAKTLQEWAEGLLKFFQGQRPGKDRGRPFTKEQLEIQHFPGSNIDAWFQMNQVPAYLQDAFWQYAITKAAYVGSSDEQINFDIMFSSPSGNTGSDNEGGVNNPAFERLRGLTSKARRDFVMAAAENPLGGGSMFQHYATRERTDTSFQAMMSKTLDPMLGMMLGPMGGLLDKIPSPIAELLYKMLTGIAPSMLGLTAGVIGDVVMNGLPGMSEGGQVPGPQVDKDVIPAVLTPGEFVVNKRAVDAVGLDFLHYINSGQVRQFTLGGDTLDAASSGSISSHLAAITGASKPSTPVASNTTTSTKKSTKTPEQITREAVAAGNIIPATAEAMTPDSGFGFGDIIGLGGSILGAGMDMMGLGPLIELAKTLLSAVDKVSYFLSAGAKLASGDFSGITSLFGGLLEPSNMAEKLFGLTGLPDAINPFSKAEQEDGSKRFDSALFSKGTLGTVTKAFAASGATGSGAAGLISSGASTVAAAAAGAVSGPKGIALRKLQERGWTQHWDALDKLWTGESGWNPNAQNPGSTAYGIAQFLDSTWKSYGIPKTSDPEGQIEAGLRYIAARYGDPSQAYAKWKSRSPHWYGQGGLISGPRVMGGVGAGEVREALIPLDNEPRLKELTESLILPAYNRSGGTQGGVTVLAPISVSVSGRPTDGDLSHVGARLGEAFSKKVNESLARHG